MNDTQLQTLAAHIRANTDPTVVEALAIRNDVALAEWYNNNSTTDAWGTTVSGQDMFDKTDIAKFDNLTAGKRDAWRLLLDFAPIDSSRSKVRKAIVDVWGTSDSVAVLQGCLVKAKQVELVFGGTSTTENTVVALKREYIGSVSLDDISNCLNKY